MRERLLTSQEAAKMLNIEHRTVQRQCARGDIFAVRPGKAWLIPESSVLAKLKAKPKPKKKVEAR